MTKATDAQVKDVKDALASGGRLPAGTRINFGDKEPIQRQDAADSDASKSDKSEKK